jgi:hypothetical protein
MRCLSPAEGYSIQAFEPDETLNIVTDNKGMSRYISRSKPTICNFYKTGLLDHEIEAALERFNFSGLPEGVHPLTRVSVFDTEIYALANYKPDEREEEMRKLDERLRELSEIFPNDFIVVDQPKAEKPWPQYDTQSLEDLLKLQEQTGISPEKVRLYESENANRPEVIEAMWRLEDPEGAAERFGVEEGETVAEVSA